MSCNCKLVNRTQNHAIFKVYGPWIIKKKKKLIPKGSLFLQEQISFESKTIFDLVSDLQ